MSRVNYNITTRYSVVKRSLGIAAKCSIPLDTMSTIGSHGVSYTLVEAKLKFDFTLSTCTQPAGMSIFFGVS